MKRSRTSRLTKLAARAAMLQRKGKTDEAYTLICDEFVSLGGVYVKFLQGVLLNSPVMKRWHSPNKLRVFEALPPEQIDIVALLRSQLGPEKITRITRLQTEPFAAGSFGQVYYGEMATGEQIIVKALRPQVRDLLVHDLRLLGLFSRFFVGRQYRGYDLKLDDAIKDFRRATLAETDYVQEARFAREMYDTHLHTEHLVIPRTYTELCTNQLIVQEYISGVSCAEVLQATIDTHVMPEEYVREKLGSNLRLQMNTIGVALVGDAFNLPRIMGDPHPGNIRLLPNDDVAMIDFGISASAPVNRPAFYGLIREWSYMHSGATDVGKLFEQFLRMFVNDLYRALKKITSLQPERDSEQRSTMMKKVGGIVNDIFNDEADPAAMEDTMNQGRMIRLLNQVVNKGNRLGLNMRLVDTDLLRSAQTFMSAIEALGVRAEVLSYVLATVVEEQGKLHPELTDPNDKQISTSQALEVINGWLERVANRDPMLFGRIMQQVTPSDHVQNTKTKQPKNPKRIVKIVQKPENDQEEQHA